MRKLFILSFPVFLCFSVLAQSEKKPNLVVILVDQLRADALGYAGQPYANTPNIDKLAASGMRFVNATSVTPVCAAMRASFFTGKYTSSTGMVINELRLNPHQRSIAHVLDDNGYATSYIGKWHLYSDCSDHDAIECAYIPPGPDRLGFNDEWKAYNFHHVNFDSYYFEDKPEKIFYGENKFEPEEQFRMAGETLERFAANGDHFAMVVSVGLPHPPWTSDNLPDKYVEMYRDVPFALPYNWQDTPDSYMDRNTDPERWQNYWKHELPGMQRVYHGMVASLDEYVGRFLGKMDELGLSDNTIVMFTSDHGEMMGENGRIFKMIFYDAASRIPLIIRWPGKIRPGISDICINTPDLMPTLLSLMHVRDQIPKEVEGMDLSKVILTGQGPEPEMAYLQGMGHTYQWKDGFEWRAVRDKHYTYAVYLKDEKELLFDNRRDPLQTRNLADDPLYRKIRDWMHAYLEKKKEQLKDPFKPCTWYNGRWVDDNRHIIAAAKGPFE